MASSRVSLAMSMDCKLGRVSLNPIKHIDPVGTILLPGFLLLLGSPFLFGYAKPVPVNFRALRNPRSGMVWVAAAGPAMNIALAIFGRARLPPRQVPARNRRAMGCGKLEERVDHQCRIGCLQHVSYSATRWRTHRRRRAPGRLCRPACPLEPYGMLIFIGLLFILPMLGAQFGADLNIVSQVIASSTGSVIRIILRLTGNT